MLKTGFLDPGPIGALVTERARAGKSGIGFAASKTKLSARLRSNAATKLVTLPNYPLLWISRHL